jgi:hypothetical protein
MKRCILFLLLAALALGQSDIENRTAQSDYEGNSIVRFSKYMYSVLGTKSAEELAYDFKEEYDTLNTDGQLGTTLNALYEMRMEDLLISVRHSKKMKEVLAVLETL